MPMLKLEQPVVKEFLDRLERQGKTDEYIDGVLEGMSFVLEFYQTMLKLNKIKSRLIEEERNVTS